MIKSFDRASNDDRVKGLFGDALKWLLKNIGVKAIDWLSKKAHDWVDQRAKGIENGGPDGGDYDCADEQEESKYDGESRE